MSVKSSESVTVDFTTQDPTTGAAADASPLPTGKLVINGADNAATVIVTNKETGVYKAAVTLPAGLTNGDEVQIRIAATVATVAGKGVIWTDYVEDKLDTLLTRLSAVRAGYLDNLNVGGIVATQAEVLSIQNNTRTTIGIPTVAERPDTGSTPLKIYLNNYDTTGNMEAPDSAPTVSVVNEAGTTRSGNLQHPTTHVPQTTMINLSAGRYWIEYDLDAADALESLAFTFTIIEGGVTRVLDRVMLVVDTTAVDFTAADRTKLDTLHDTRIPGVIQPQTGDAFAAVGALNDLSTAEMLAMIFEGTETFGDHLRLSRAVLYGILAGGGTGTITMRDRANLKNRITATVDANGNRSVVTTDAT